MIIDIVTIFPEFFDAFINTSIMKRAQAQGLVKINCHQLRDYSVRKNNYIDDTPYGGGSGMLMQFPPFYKVINQLRTPDTKVILLSPQGQMFNQEKAINFSKIKHLILLCGHYEGIDARVLEFVDEEISIGNYVLTGGEIPAMILSDAIVRLVPGVIDELSRETDSLQNGWLKYPQYTKPDSYEGRQVPEILKSGHHKNIEDWRQKESIKATYEKRPDLIKDLKLSKKEETILAEIKAEKNK
ncbi:tRNA (guanosine(37)-N1)-methyltransferase TrmD [Mycoplasmatota bacterium]|nr:tRNA (guanosine(37)-N1)-methyltransferase TrmD [Mycoplasmatota bacterium]